MRSLRYWFWSTSLVLGTALCIVVVVGLNLWLCVKGPSFLQTSANQEHARSIEAWGEPLQATKISQSAVRFDDSGPIRQVCYRYTNKYGDSRAICGYMRQAGIKNTATVWQQYHTGNTWLANTTQHGTTPVADSKVGIRDQLALIGKIEVLSIFISLVYYLGRDTCRNALTDCHYQPRRQPRRRLALA